MIILGISGVLGHDAAACVMRDGELLAFAEEERFTRQKHAMGSFPLMSTTWCLASSGIRPHDVEVIAASWDPSLAPDLAHLGDWATRFLAHPVWQGRRPTISHVPHHLSHAVAPAFFEGVESAAVLVIDGNGEHTSTTIARLDGAHFHVLEEYPVSQSLGHFYARAAQYLGLGQHGEGRLMGLAGYGTAVNAIEPIAIDANGYRVHVGEDRTAGILDQLRQTASFWDGWYRQAFGQPQRLDWAWDDDTWRVSAESPNVVSRADVGASVQEKLVDTVVTLARRATELTGSRTLIVSGGVALNGGANAAILDRGVADRLVFFPACQDAGGALGAAAWVARQHGCQWQQPGQGTYLGPRVRSGEAARALDRSGLSYRHMSDPATEAAERIARGRVVAWCHGAMEAGPRALGNRSILARADDPAIAARVNRIKGRESWRPFGPSIRLEDVGHFFERATASPYMLEFRRIRDSARGSLAAVAHVDGTTRPQTVTGDGNGIYHRLIGAVGEATGVPAVINTSFNVGPEPIVCSPGDAIRTFVSSDLDDLFLDDCVVSKRDR